MELNAHLQRLRCMLRQVVAEASIETGEPSLESARSVGADEEIAARAMQKVTRGEALNTEDAGVLEAIILPRYRPVIDIVHDSFSSPSSPWGHLVVGEFKRRIESAIPSVGRLEIPGHRTLPYAGTGFVVGTDLIMTNRHVAQLFATGLGHWNLGFQPGQKAAIDFKRELVPSEPIHLSVSRVVMIHPYWDMALLEVAGLPRRHHALSLVVSHPNDLDNHEIVVIGYPAFDPRNATDIQNRIFRGVFDVKRLQPGLLRSREIVRSFGHDVNALTHDASTLSGNSGSAILDISDGRIVALHFAGEYLKANYAVPAYELARDKRVVDAGVNFAGRIDSTDEWLAAWRLTVPEDASQRTDVPILDSDDVEPSSQVGFT